MTDSNYTRVYTGNFAQVQSIVSRLKELGISAVVRDDAESARLGGFGAPAGMQQIFVHKDELDKAVPLVQEMSANI
ncbi:DUF2007 domain-containing protein [Spongiivirga sp. MCCC 1A20706]|uniref:DUF2007 domain-containing protein n=1 Tax=Spongiivirga sp. MCCC 1A20706 TaxID=3160963 RepID=UPI003977CC85